MYLVGVGIRSTVGSVSSERIRLWECFVLKRCVVFLLDVWMLVLWLISGLAKLVLSEALGQRGWEKRKLVEVVMLLIYGSSFYEFVNTTLS